MKKRFFDFAKGLALAAVSLAVLLVGCTPDEPVGPNPGPGGEVVIPDISKIDLDKTWPLISTIPAFVDGDSTEDVIVVVNAAGSALEAGGVNIYAHTGVLTNNSSSEGDWKYVKHEWTENGDDCKLTKVEANLWKLTIKGGPRAFYGVPAGETIKKMAFVFRNENGTKEVKNSGADIFVTLSSAKANVVMKAAAEGNSTISFDIDCPNGTYTNLITGEKVTVSGGKYHNSLDAHEFVVLTKVN